ncbi:serine/threonine-protein kinase [Trichocoleus sp. DQ-U1]|uniref:serine/threonine-protein kinase n=1 Tax=Trichocoleus sp. DQ-U1 TaxID=2933926 RepID=UPI00329709B9
MSLCINPHCQNPQNPDSLMRCQSCDSYLLLEGQYRVTNLLSDKGGFGDTYEVSDPSGTPKLLKVLKKNQPKAVEQFQREAQVLSRLNHPGIPQGEQYFTFYPHNTQQPVHCLVMEKIEGENLQEWLEKRSNRPINENLAIDWLTQLTNTLHTLHQQQPPLIHRDIKPSNIMLKPDGKLVLIDFGIAREMTGTYEQQKAAGQVTKVVSDGYSPLEQVNGCAVLPSDFFALGRTFVHLLTGMHPTDIADSFNHDLYTDELKSWRDKAPQISPLVGDFIDKLMARSIQNRPPRTETILEQLAAIDQALHPTRQLKPKPFNSEASINWQKLTLERTVGDLSSWHSAPVTSVAISPDGEILVSGSVDTTIKVWNLNNGEEIYTTGHSAPVTCLAISPDGETLVSGSQDRTVRIWNLKTGQATHSLQGHSNHVMSVAVHPNGQSVFSGSGDKTIKIWNLKTGKATHTHNRHLSTVSCIAVSPNGQTLVSGSFDKTIIVWTDHILSGHSDIIRCVAISPDGQTLVSGSEDKEINIWNLISGERLGTLTGHSAPVLSLAISPDGQFLVSGSVDKTIKVWNLSTRQEIHELSRHLDSVNSVAISPDGQTLVSGSSDCTIKVWRIQ